MRMNKRAVIGLAIGMAFSSHAYADVQSAAPAGEGFTAGEHVIIGDHVKIYLEHNDKGSSASEGRLLHLQNGMALTYGNIVSLGDFYGTPGQAIAYGKTRADRNGLFLSAYAQFAASSSVVPEVQKILDVTNEERVEVEHAVAHGEKVADVYARIAEDHNRRYNCITGGGCSGKWWLDQGRYLQLAKTDYDHFGDAALAAYRVGHALAIEQAIKARETGDKQQLEMAYAMNALASHFLSDRFAAGHIRTPRHELDINITPAVVGSLLSHYMHDEDGTSGLHVHNRRGDEWIAYGDRHYFDTDNAQHRHLLQEAMQASADEVFAAYETGASAEDVAELIVPEPDVRGDTVGSDIAPMFYWDEARAVLYRRQNLSNPRDFHFTKDWWGWSTLAELSSLYGLPK